MSTWWSMVPGPLAASAGTALAGAGALAGAQALVKSYGATSTTDPSLLAAGAQAQINAALYGTWIDHVGQATADASAFKDVPGTDAVAYFVAAFWMAVAARVLRSRTMAAEAQVLVGEGRLAYAIPGTALRSSNVAGVLSQAAATIRTAAQTADTQAQSSEAMGAAGVLAGLAALKSVSTARNTKLLIAGGVLVSLVGAYGAYRLYKHVRS